MYGLNARDIYKQHMSLIPSVQYCPLKPLMQVHVTREPLRTQVPLLWQGFGLQLVGGAGVDDVGIGDAEVGGGGVGGGVVGGSETEEIGRRIKKTINDEEIKYINK